ncbi:MAG: hypothetical protein GY819_13125 [Planctomycetaceae bacterium]|nr:hypothetical protein [Planctomycetaceae bacterium]
MSAVRKSLYQRLPEIYREKDQQRFPSGQLQAWLDILDQPQSALHDNIEALYHDLFIETCHDWAVPYIADLLGTSHLSGDPWALRADVARTIKHRRRKGTLGSIESLTHALTQWAVHTVELRDRIVWNQHLNHQRPDRNGEPPLPLLPQENGSIGGAVQGGTVTLRDPALLGLYGGAFDPFARVIDVKPISTGAQRHNFPNLAIFLWRLSVYTLPVIRPVMRINERFKPAPEPVQAGAAEFVVGFDLHPLGEPMVLFNRHRYQADAELANLTGMDAVPGPMPTARLSEDTPTGNPAAYVKIDHYSPAVVPTFQPGDDSVGLNLHLPDTFNKLKWKLRGANLCAWQAGLRPALREYEIAIDPDHGRILFGVKNQAAEANVIADGLFASPAFGFSGPTGAHPAVRKSLQGKKIQVSFDSYIDEAGVTHNAANGAGLQKALNNLPDRTKPLLIEIMDSRTYPFNLNAVSDIGEELGLKVLRLSRSLHIRAASGQRPIVRLTRPLAFRPEDVTDPGVDNLNVHLEGLYITWSHGSPFFGATTALIERAAINRLRIEQCTLDPGSHETIGGIRQPVRYGFNLDNVYGLGSADRKNFKQVPEIELVATICGPIAADDGYRLTLQNSIVDAASGIGADSPALAVHAATGNAEDEWGPELEVEGMTCFGRMRVSRATGEGGIWVHALQVHDDLSGCIKFSYFSGNGDKLPQHQGCVFAGEAALSFSSEIFCAAGYAQIRLRSDRRILEQGPGRDAMGAFGYLQNTHKWKNINIRYREFVPVGIRPVLVPVT